MNLKELTNIVFSKTSKLIQKEGENLFNKNLVSNISSKRINNIYNIYGKVTDSKETNIHYTQIKINLLNKTLEETKCNCTNFSENYKYNKRFLCPHLADTMYKFYDLAKKKANKKVCKNNNSGDKILSLLKEENKDKEPLDIKIKINYKNNSRFFEVEFKIGKDRMYLIDDLEEFIKARNEGLSFCFNKDFIYDGKDYSFSSEDEKIIDFIDKYVSINREIHLNNLSSSFSFIKGRKLIVPKDNLKDFLQTIHNKKIIFNYCNLDYYTKVLHKDLPLSFTIKEINNTILLKSQSTQKRFPINLNSKNDVYFFDRDLYIPSKKQIKYYLPLYEELKKDGEILFSKNIENFKNILDLVALICKDIIIDEKLNKFKDSLFKANFYIDKKEERITCSCIISYGENKVDIIDEKNNNNIIRDYKKEGYIERELERLKFIKRDKNFLFIGDDYDTYNFLSKGLKILESIGRLELSSSFKEIKFLNSLNIESSIIEEDNFFKLFYSIEGIEKEEFKDIFQYLDEGKTFYKTKKNNFLDLEDEKLCEFFYLLKGLNYDYKDKEDFVTFSKNKGYYIENKIKNNGLSFIRGEKTLEKIKSKLDNIKDKEYILSKDFKGTLRNYQIEGFNWLKSLSYMGFGGILADEMGLGKTIQIISFLLSEKDKKSLVVTPTSLIYNWKDEFERFAPTLKIGVIHGDKKSREKVFLDIDEYDVILTTYGTLRRDFNLYNNKTFDFVIIDEGQNIKNPDAESTIKVKGIKGKIKFALTGTPMENNLMELWSIFDFIMPDYLYTKEKFKESYITSKDTRLEDLKTLIHLFILRRTKKDVLKELPDKIEKKFLVEMTEGQRAIYKNYIKEVKKNLKDNKENKITIFSYLTKLRQLCLDPSLIIDNYKLGSGKLKIAMSLIEEAIKNNKKILLFSQFTSVLKNISNILESKNIKYMYLDGSTKAKERVDMVKEFNEDSSIKIFLISLKAGGTGLNLTSANMVIHFDPWWNPTVEDQATDRAHRLGQKNIVEVIKLVSKGTIEEKIVELKEDKKELINDILSGDLKDSKAITSLSYDEIVELFN